MIEISEDVKDKRDFTNICIENVDADVMDEEFNALFEKFRATTSSSHAREEEGASDIYHRTPSTPSPRNNLPPSVSATAMITPYHRSLNKKTHGNMCSVSLPMEMSPKSKSWSLIPLSPLSLVSSPSATTNSPMPSPSPSPLPIPVKREQIPPSSPHPGIDIVPFKRPSRKTKLDVLAQYPRIPQNI